MLVFGFFAVIFIGIGILLYHSSDGIFQLVKRYDDAPDCTENMGGTCAIDFFQIDDDKKSITSAPKDQDFFVYYELTRFY